MTTKFNIEIYLNFLSKNVTEINLYNIKLTYYQIFLDLFI